MSSFEILRSFLKIYDFAMLAGIFLHGAFDGVIGDNTMWSWISKIKATGCPTGLGTAKAKFAVVLKRKFKQRVVARIFFFEEWREGGGVETIIYRMKIIKFIPNNEQRKVNDVQFQIHLFNFIN